MKTRLASMFAALFLTLVSLVVAANPAQASMPTFQMPFPCGQTWHASTYGGHSAIDWNAYPSDAGQPVVASAAGTASTGYEAGGCGNYVLINHGDGWQTRYAHLQSTGVSGAVAQGQVIGYVGSTGDSNLPHLHWEQIYNGVRQATLYANGSVVTPGTSYSPNDPSYVSGNGCGGSSGSGQISLLDVDSAVWAKDSLGYGGWARQTAAATANKVDVGGNVQMIIDGCAAVHAKNTLSYGGWVKETECGTATAIAVSSTGVQMLLDGCGAVHAKSSIGYGGWTQETTCGTATAIAVGGSTQMILTSASVVHAKDTIGYGGWVQETASGTATAIAAGESGLQMIIDGCAAVHAKNTIGAGGWTQETGCGTASAIAAGGNVQMIVDGCAAVHAKSSIGYGGWTQETNCGTASAIAVGSGGRQVLLDAVGAVHAKDSIGSGGWSRQTADSTAGAIAAG